MLHLAQPQHSTSPKEHHLDCEAWWWQHHVMGMFLNSRDWRICQERRKNVLRKIQKNLRGKPAALCKKAEIGTDVHLWALQQPEAHSQSYSGVAKEQKDEGHWVAKLEPGPKSNRKSVVWLEDCCPSTLPIQLDWGWTVLYRRMGKYCPIKVCKVGRHLS